MRKLLILALVVVLAGCVGTPAQNNVTVYNDTSLANPAITPQGYVTQNNLTVQAIFDEPVILTAFKINNLTQNTTRVGDGTFSVTNSFTDGTYSVFVSAEDASGNVVQRTAQFIVDTVAPTLTLDPENNEQVATTDVTFTLNFSEEVELTEAKVGSTALAFITTNNKDYTVEKNLAEGTYTLSITASDLAGNIVTSNTSFSVSISAPDTSAPPQITGVNATNTGEGAKLKLSWDATSVNDFREYRLYKSSTTIENVFGLTPSYTITVKSTTHKYFTGLTNGANYCFAVTAVDNSGNENTVVVDDCASPSIIDLTAPYITDYSPTSTINTATQTISVTTNEAATCESAVSTTSDEYYDFSNLTSMTCDTNKTTHTKSLSNGNETYYVYVLCKDEEGNTMAETEEWSFTVLVYDTTPPVISAVSASTGLTYAVVIWTTDEASNSSVISIDANFTEESSSDMVTAHSLNTTNLAQGSSYNYKVQSCDASGYCANSSQYSFTTGAPNNAPNVTDVNMTLSPAYTSTDLTCQGTYTDADGDLESGSTFRWFINGSEEAEQTAVTLGNAIFARNDQILCEYTPSDGIVNGTAVNSTTLTISNSPPTTTIPVIDPPNTPSTNVNLNCTYTYSDDDNDTEGATSFKWFVNGTLSGVGNVQVVPNANTGIKDEWLCEVTPNDGTDPGTPTNSTSVTVVA